jgi:ABC-type nickel/cobalt efflux system permease component RcnA
MSFWIFTIATLLSMPKQMAVVYVGYAIRSSADGEESTASKIVKWVILVITGIITVLAAWYLYRKMEVARPEVQRKLRLNRYTLLSEASGKGAPTPVPGILLNKEGGRDSFATMRRTETGQSGERIPSGSVRPQNASAAGDLGIIVDPYGHYDEDPSYAQGPVKGDQATQYYPSRNADHAYGYPSSRGRNNVDGIQMRQLAPPRGASLGRGVTTMADAGRSTDQLLPARGGEEIPFPTSSSPPRTHLQLHRGSFIPHQPSPPREHQSAAEQHRQNTPPRLEPLDVDVLLAATTRSTPPRSAVSASAEADGSSSARPSPPRYETLEWAEARDGHQDGSPRRR